MMFEYLVKCKNCGSVRKCVHAGLSDLNEFRGWIKEKGIYHTIFIPCRCENADMLHYFVGFYDKQND